MSKIVFTIKMDRPKIERSEVALDAKMRRAPTMKHTNAGRGGSANWRDLLDADGE